MKARLSRLCAELFAVNTLADIGCDHGYLTEYALKHQLCQHAYAVDISPNALENAKKRLKEYADRNQCTFIVADGMQQLPPSVDCVVIAGMGGEEIIEILTQGFVPRQFILQPMNYSEQLRRFLVARGCRIIRDYTFFADRFYDVIVGQNIGGERIYQNAEYEFGWDNLHPQHPGENADFCKRLHKLIALQAKYIQKSPNDRVAEQLKQRKKYLEEILYGCN